MALPASRERTCSSTATTAPPSSTSSGSTGDVTGGIEFKYAALKGTKGMTTAMNDLSLSQLWIVYPGTEAYSLAKDITVLPLSDIQSPWPYPKG
ncbi:MAG: hypothetical protein ACLFQR_12445 [Desulfovibrionales bacterium]